MSYLLSNLIHGHSQTIISLMHNIGSARQVDESFASFNEEVARFFRIDDWITWQGCDRFITIIPLDFNEFFTCTNKPSIRIIIVA